MSLGAGHRCLFHLCLHCSACLRWRKQLLGAAPGKDGSLCTGSPASCCRMIHSPWGAAQECSRIPREWCVPQGCCGDPPEHRLLSLTALQLCAPAAAPALMSPQRQYLLSGAELCSTVQNMRSCLPLLGTHEVMLL